ncbi:MAG TPA: nuclear transport factor 2 family protein [Cyclobacteriaceae bacterium]|nr:nuclear transport factor 2 family protein [Cyclobacteriaceae bacterium]
MEKPTDLVIKFYSAFQQGDYKTMQTCYHPDTMFSDELFPLLKGRQVKAMWHMLVDNGKDSGLQITFDNVRASGGKIECDWEARYRLSMTGRNIQNKIHARFEISDDLIVRHVDHFDFYRWAGMAFGIKGVVLGWAPFFKHKVQQAVGQRLQKFIDNHSEYQSAIKK